MKSFNHKLDRVNAACLGLMIVVFGLGAFSSTQSDSVNWADLGEGSWQQRYEAEFESNLPQSSFISAAYQTLQFLGFGQVQSDVFIGTQKWLFSETELKVTDGFESRLQQNIETVSDLSSQLSASNINVLVVVVPDKARIEFERLGTDRGQAIQSRKGTIVNGLRDRGIAVFDAFDALSAPQLHQTFLRTDTHWTPEGAIAVANAAMQSVNWPVGEKAKLIRAGERVHQGDLYRILDLGPFQTVLGFEDETVATYQLVQTQEANENSLFGDVTRPIHLVGTSYSHDPNWHFADALEARSGHAVMNFAQLGYGPLKPMQDYIKSLTNGLAHPELVIWEIPEKYMSLDPSEMSERADD